MDWWYIGQFDVAGWLTAYWWNLASEWLGAWTIELSVRERSSSCNFWEVSWASRHNRRSWKLQHGCHDEPWKRLRKEGTLPSSPQQNDWNLGRFLLYVARSGLTLPQQRPKRQDPPQHTPISRLKPNNLKSLRKAVQALLIWNRHWYFQPDLFCELHVTREVLQHAPQSTQHPWHLEHDRFHFDQYQRQYQLDREIDNAMCFPQCCWAGDHWWSVPGYRCHKWQWKTVNHDWLPGISGKVSCCCIWESWFSNAIRKCIHQHC